MATQNPELNLKGRDAGWEGKQVQTYTCSDCGALVSNPNQMNGWHTNLSAQLNNLATAIQNEATARQQGDQQLNQNIQSAVQSEAQARQQADQGLSNRISALGG